MKTPWKRPIARPTRSANRIDDQPVQPCLVFSTAMMAAARPLTTPTERSISPSSSTSTTPVAMMPTAVIWRNRLVMFPEVRKFSSEMEK